MSRYLARFFRHPATGIQQRHLMLANGSWVLGEWIGPDVAMNSDDPDFLEKLSSGKLIEAMSNARFFEENYEDSAACVAAFERLADDARTAGFTERDIDDRMVDDILESIPAKPVWKAACDRGWLAIMTGQATQLTVDDVNAEAKPMAQYIAARLVFGRDESKATDARRLLEAARDAIAERRKSKLPIYAWTIGDHELEASIYEWLFWVADAQGDHPAMFTAIRRACEISTDTRRSEALAFVQSHIYTDYIEDAFETAFRYAEFGYDAVKSHPDFAAYAKRRRREQKSKTPIHRWAAMTSPSSLTDIQSAEATCAVQFPEDYRRFLAERGESTLMFHVGTESKILRFVGAQDFAAWQLSFQNWLDITGGPNDEAFADWSKTHGVGRRALFTVATPWDNSACLALCLVPGPRYGHGFWWDHDEASELVHLGTSFSACLETITRRFSSSDVEIMAMLGIYPDA